MVAQKIESVVAELREEAERLKGDLSEAEKKADGIRSELAQIEGAIASLTGKKPAKKAGGKRASGGSGYTTAEVVPLVAEVLADGPLDGEEIGKRVAARATEAKRSKAGLHLRVKKALEDERFNETAGKYALSS